MSKKLFSFKSCKAKKKPFSVMPLEINSVVITNLENILYKRQKYHGCFSFCNTVNQRNRKTAGK